VSTNNVIFFVSFISHLHYLTVECNSPQTNVYINHNWLDKQMR